MSGRQNTKKNKVLRPKMFHKLYGISGVGKCCYCGIAITEKTCTLEHKVPKFFGGSDDESNLDLACNTCNNIRGNQLGKLANKYFQTKDGRHKFPSSEKVKELLEGCLSGL